MIRGRDRHVRWLVIAVVSLALAGCATVTTRRERLMFDIGPHKTKKLERITTQQEDREAVAGLVALANYPASKSDNWRAAFDRIRQQLENEASPIGRGYRESFPPPQLRPEVVGALHAAVASRVIAPGQGDLPVRPHCFLLRALSGRSRPPLAGWGARLQTNIPSLTTRLMFREQYYAHLFKESRTAPAGSLTNRVKVLVLQGTNGEKFYWVRTDLIGAFQDLRAEVLFRAWERGFKDIHDGNLLLHGTHTHSGPGAIGTRLISQLATVDLFDESVFDFVAEQILEAILEADASLAPARLGLGSGKLTTITRNRRKGDRCAYDPPDLDPHPDPEVGVVRIDDANGNALATVVNFAIHGTSLKEDNLVYSPDNMGHAEQRIESRTGAMALFFNGAEGDVSPVHGINAEDIGKALGDAVFETWESVETSSNVRLRSTYCQFDDPNVSPCFPRPCPDNLERFDFRPFKFVENPLEAGCYLDRDESLWSIPIAKSDDPPYIEREGVVLGAFRIDTPDAKAVVLTLPGEPITEIGANLKADAGDLGFDHAWVFSLSNALMGYIVTEREYHEGGYEAGSNMFGPTAGAVFTDISLGLAGQVASQP